MANLAQKNGIYLVRFRFQNKEFKRSLKIRERTEAEAARRLVEVTIHRLTTGQLSIPPGVDPGDFIVSGGHAKQKRSSGCKTELPTMAQLIEAYLARQRPLVSPNYHACQAIHLRHLQRFLDHKVTLTCDQLTTLDLEQFLHHRLQSRHPITVNKERVTIRSLFAWATNRGSFQTSPAEQLPAMKGGKDRPAFRTSQEIERILARDGMTEEEKLQLWECLYLAPKEIAELLETVRFRAHQDASFFLHAIAAYTGMRRGEILRLRWLDVNLEEEHVFARSRKQSRSQSETVRRIDMHPELKSLLAHRREKQKKGQYVLCDADTLHPLAVDKANRLFWQPMRGTLWCLVSKKNWFKVGFHTYRHSFASNLAARGVDQRIIDEFMGHQTEEMRKRYRHLFPKDRRSAIVSFSFHPNG